MLFTNLFIFCAKAQSLSAPVFHKPADNYTILPILMKNRGIGVSLNDISCFQIICLLFPELKANLPLIV